MKTPDDLSLHVALLSEALGEVLEWVKEAERTGETPPSGTLLKIRRATQIKHLTDQVEALQRAQKMLKDHKDIAILTASLADSIAYLQQKIDGIKEDG